MSLREATGHTGFASLLNMISAEGQRALTPSLTLQDDWSAV